MTDLVRAELLKWRTTRSLYTTVLGVVLIVALSVSASIATAGQNGAAALGTTEGLRSAFGAAANGGFLVMIMGIITSAGEYRHNTITSAVLITPRRSPIIAAKAAAMAIMGAAMAIVACAVTLAIALPWLAAKGIHPALLSVDVGLVLAGSAAVITLFGLIGVGIGSMVRNQVAAIVGALAWLMVVEQLLVKLLPTVGRFLAFGASGSLIGAVDADLLPAGAAAVLLVAYAAAFTAGGVYVTARRDIVA
jgi:ABC-2 type transport system permease protein